MEHGLEIVKEQMRLALADGADPVTNSDVFRWLCLLECPRASIGELRERLGDNWCVAKRATPRLREKYDRIVTPKQMAEIERQIVASRP